MGPDVKEKWYEICKFFVRKWLLGSPRSVKRFWMVLQTQYSFKLNWYHFRMTMESIKWFRLASKFLTNFVNLTDRKSHVWILKNLTKVSPLKKSHQKNTETELSNARLEFKIGSRSAKNQAITFVQKKYKYHITRWAH